MDKIIMNTRKQTNMNKCKYTNIFFDYKSNKSQYENHHKEIPDALKRIWDKCSEIMSQCQIL